MGKTISVSNLYKTRQALPKQTEIVLATGVFDILHVEHVRFLNKAKKHGDLLVVGIESDARVQKLKGKKRPIYPEVIRAEVLGALESVNLITILPKNLNTKHGREEFIKKLRPTMYAVSENTPFLAEKKRIMKIVGGKVKTVHRYNPSFSTTKILKNLN